MLLVTQPLEAGVEFQIGRLKSKLMIKILLDDNLLVGLVFLQCWRSANSLSLWQIRRQQVNFLFTYFYVLKGTLQLIKLNPD